MSRINYARMQEDNTRHFLFWLFVIDDSLKDNALYT